jgi:hypothetical protein
MSKQFSVIIVPHDNRTTWSFRVSYRLVIIFLALLGLAGVSMAAFVITYGRLAGLAQRSVTVSRENDRLKYQLAQVDSLRTELVNLQAFHRLPRVHPSNGWRRTGGWGPRSSASCWRQCRRCGR